MNVKQLKNIMKEVNEPNEFLLQPFDLGHVNYWIYKIDGVRVKTLFSKIEPLRKPSARFDVFINGLFIRDIDYVFEQIDNDFYIKFIRTQFPEFDRFGNIYQLDETDEIKINGDLEQFI
jgi:hypothetical protein